MLRKKERKKIFIKKKESVQRGVLSARKGKVIRCRGAEDRKGAETNSGKSGARNVEEAYHWGGKPYRKWSAQKVNSGQDTFPAVSATGRTHSLPISMTMPTVLMLNHFGAGRQRNVNKYYTVQTPPFSLPNLLAFLRSKVLRSLRHCLGYKLP